MHCAGGRRHERGSPGGYLEHPRRNPNGRQRQKLACPAGKNHRAGRTRRSCTARITFRSAWPFHDLDDDHLADQTEVRIGILVVTIRVFITESFRNSTGKPGAALRIEPDATAQPGPSERPPWSLVGKLG